MRLLFPFCLNLKKENFLPPPPPPQLCIRQGLLPEELKSSLEGIRCMKSVSDKFKDYSFGIFPSPNSKKVKAKVTVEPATKAQRRSRGITLLFL
jgi:hypothetical protein